MIIRLLGVSVQRSDAGVGGMPASRDAVALLWRRLGSGGGGGSDCGSEIECAERTKLEVQACCQTLRQPDGLREFCVAVPRLLESERLSDEHQTRRQDENLRRAVWPQRPVAVEPELVGEAMQGVTVALDEPCHCWPSQKCRDDNACEHLDDAGCFGDLGWVRFECVMEVGWLLGVTKSGIPRRKARLERLYIQHL